MNKVVHLVRWLLPFTASFIRNQIVYHRKYVPSVVFAQKKAGPFFEEIAGKFEVFYPFEEGFDQYLYKKTRMLLPRVKNEIKQFIISNNPDVLHVHFGVDCLIYADIIKTLNIPSCVSFYGYDCTSFPSRFFGYGKILLKKRVFFNPAVKAVLAMTEDMKKDLIKLGCPPEKIIVHYYGTETAPFYLARSLREKARIDLLMLSGLHEKKGHLFLLDAFAKLSASSQKELHLHIVGDGPLRSAIEDKVAELQLSNVTIYGPVQYGSKIHLDFLEMADIFVHPSIVSPDGDKEGIPGSLIEAMAAGLPVISTFHAGIPSIIENEKTGLLVEEWDRDALQAAMGRLIQDAGLRNTIAKAGQDYATRYLDVKNKELELEQIYDSLNL